MKRYGMSLPINGVPLNEHKDWIREMVDLGYTDLWGSEAGGQDGFTPLALASAWHWRRFRPATRWWPGPGAGTQRPAEG